MNRTRVVLAFSAVALSSVLAYFLRDVVYALIIVPLFYLLWVVQSVYALIPQLFIWVVLLIGITMLVLINFAPEGPNPRRKEEKRRRSQGQVEALAVWFARTNKGNYFKWQIANRLGLIAKGTWGIMGGRSRLMSDNAEVEKYLDAGLNTSFVDYPPPKNRYLRRAPTSLDLDPELAVDYLESQMETSRGRHI